MTSACSLFPAGDPVEGDSATSGTSGVGTSDATTGVDTDDTSATTSSTTMQGIRVFPQYRLQDIDAIVTLQDGTDEPVACAAEASGVGYLCDASGVVSTSVELHVERDGFEPATVTADVVPDTIEERTIHLVPAGGPTAMWSGCVADSDFESCDAACGSTQLTCAPASCASNEPAEPYATLMRFDSPDCMGTPSPEAVACDAPAELDGVSWLQCCCES
jgi:hypothetical protein